MEQDGALKAAAEEAQAVAPPETLKIDEERGTWAQAKWASIKSKARDAREFAVTMTRQTFSMFGDGEANKVEPDDQAEGASKNEPSSSSSQSQ